MEQYKTKKAKIGDVIIPKKRGKLEYVVEKAVMEGGGHQLEMSGHHSYFPDGWHVTARQLKKDGEYNSSGRLIDFYQSGCFCDMIEEVTVVGKMKVEVTYRRIE